MVNVTVDPLTRIEGHLRVSTEVNADGVITDAQSSSVIFRALNVYCRIKTPPGMLVSLLRESAESAQFLIA